MLCLTIDQPREDMDASPSGLLMEEGEVVRLKMDDSRDKQPDPETESTIHSSSFDSNTFTSEDTSTFTVDQSHTDGTHALYLQKDAMEFLSPISFEDGMDYEECQLYYACQKAQTMGGIVAKVMDDCIRRPSSTHVFQHAARNSLISCLRKSRFSAASPPPVRRMRRSSFTATPAMAGISSLFARTNSTRAIEMSSPRVSFEAYVSIVTIHSFRDFPKKMRSRMWMSRREMQRCMDRAMSEDWFLESVQRKEGVRNATRAFLKSLKTNKSFTADSCRPKDVSMDLNEIDALTLSDMGLHRVDEIPSCG